MVAEPQTRPRAPGRPATIKVAPGECHLAGAGEVLVTTLGSCIAACVRDPTLGVGGMNHFLLPDAGGLTASDAGTRYGAYAMEHLINAVLKLGGRRQRLEVKVFGGGQMTVHMAHIGAGNVAFVRAYLAREGLTVAGADLGGHWPRIVRFEPATGRARIKRLPAMVGELDRAEQALLRRNSIRRDAGEVELF